MKKGEVAWIKIGPKYHGQIYHNYCKRDHVAKDAVIGPDIWIKLGIDSIKRQPPYKDDSTYAGKLQYYETIREIARELVAEGEYSNAQ